MADILKIIKQRKTVFEFSSRAVKESDLKKILEAAKWAPSSHNCQPWKFIVVRDKAIVDKLMDVAYYGFFHTAPQLMVVAVLVPPEKKMPGMFRGKNAEMAAYHKYIDIGQPVLSMAYEAASLGVGSCQLSLMAKEANRLLGVPAGHEAILALGLGYERKGAYVRKREREALSSTAYSERYGRRF